MLVFLQEDRLAINIKVFGSFFLSLQFDRKINRLQKNNFASLVFFYGKNLRVLMVE